MEKNIVVSFLTHGVVEFAAVLMRLCKKITAVRFFETSCCNVGYATLFEIYCLV